MKKSNYGFKLWAYPALAFLLCLFGQTLLCGLLLGFVILVENNEWVTRNTLKAFMLCFVTSVMSTISRLLSVVTWIPFLGTAVNSVLGLISAILGILVLLLCITGILNVSKGKEFVFPFIDALINNMLREEEGKAEPVNKIEGPTE